MNVRIRLPDREDLCRNLGDKEGIFEERIQRILMCLGCLAECRGRRIASGIRRKLWAVVAFPVSQNRNRCNGAVTADQRLTVLNSKDVIWQEHGAGRILHGILDSSRVGKPLLLAGSEHFTVFRILLQGKLFLCIVGKLRGIPAFASERKQVDHAKTVDQGNGPFGKTLGTGKGIARGQLKHDIGTPCKSHFCTEIFVHHCRGTTLYEVSAHDNDDVIGLCHGTGF